MFYQTEMGYNCMFYQTEMGFYFAFFKPGVLGSALALILKRLSHYYLKKIQLCIIFSEVLLLNLKNKDSSNEVK